MAAEELRKKWGTIFMGEREATMEQLDAMQEPVLRERSRKEQEQNYLERVRQRAAERAREILGEAYAERQKVLDEARREAEARRDGLLQEAEKLKAAAKAGEDEAGAALRKAEELRNEAESIRDRAHAEGFQAGMEQAKAELKDFRAEIGRSFAGILQAIDAQLSGITEHWRDALVDLVQTAVSTATGWLLDAKHEEILRELVIESLSLLEDRSSVTVRVNPDDEAVVSDMFKAAREKIPELHQWIVNGDEKITPGGLVVETVSGSVDCRREHFTETVGDILRHLTLPESDSEDLSGVHARIAAETARFAPETPDAGKQAGEAAVVKPASAQPEATEQEPAVISQPPEVAGDTVQPQVRLELEQPAQKDAAEPAGPDSPPAENIPAAQDTSSIMQQEVSQDLASAETAPPAQSDAAPTPNPETGGGRAASPAPQAAGDTGQTAQTASDPAGEDAATVHRDEQAVAKDNPSLSELEEELFPIGGEEKDVLAHGGFLPADGAHRT